MNKTRLEAFSDGVLAIIITIMVLELKVPEGHEWSDLSKLLPKFLSYVLSFLYIGIYWGNHHHLVHTASRVTSSVMLANLNLLFWLSLIPFTTGWIGESHFAEKPVALYSANLLLAGMAYYILQWSIIKTALPHEKLSHAMKSLKDQGNCFPGFLCAVDSTGICITHGISQYQFYLCMIWLIPDKGIERAFREHA